MGGIIILASIIIPTLLFARLDVYVLLMLLTTIWLRFLGFLDDYIKIIGRTRKARPANSRY